MNSWLMMLLHMSSFGITKSLARHYCKKHSVDVKKSDMEKVLIELRTWLSIDSHVVRVTLPLFGLILLSACFFVLKFETNVNFQQRNKLRFLFINNDRFYEQRFTGFLKNFLDEYKIDRKDFDCDSNLTGTKPILESVREDLMNAILEKLNE
jgi:hypothetical protein